MRQTLIRYTIVASIGAFLALFMSSCGTTSRFAKAKYAKSKTYKVMHTSKHPHCEAYR